jgi:hypothetical protein
MEYELIVKNRFLFHSEWIEKKVRRRRPRRPG